MQQKIRTGTSSESTEDGIGSGPNGDRPSGNERHPKAVEVSLGRPRCELSGAPFSGRARAISTSRARAVSRPVDEAHLDARALLAADELPIWNAPMEVATCALANQSADVSRWITSSKVSSLRSLS
jgi:hypothetical protein